MDDFAVAAAVILGCAIMVRAGKVAAAPRAASAAENDSATGFVLMAAYLLFDAILAQVNNVYSNVTIQLYRILCCSSTFHLCYYLPLG